MRTAAQSLTILAVTAGFVGLAYVLQNGSDRDSDAENPLLQNVTDTVAQFDGFAPRTFAKTHGWTIWYFQTSFGFKCVASKPAEDEKPAPPGAVFMRQSVGDLRLDIWIDDGYSLVRVPNEVGELNFDTSGYYRPQGAAFFKQIRYDELAALDGAKVELKPFTPISGSFTYGPIDLGGIKAATAILRKCDASGPPA